MARWAPPEESTSGCEEDPSRGTMVAPSKPGPGRQRSPRWCRHPTSPLSTLCYSNGCSPHAPSTDVLIKPNWSRSYAIHLWPLFSGTLRFDNKKTTFEIICFFYFNAPDPTSPVRRRPVAIASRQRLSPRSTASTARPLSRRGEPKKATSLHSRRKSRNYFPLIACAMFGLN